MSKTYSLVWSKANWKSMDVSLFLWAARTCIFRRNITFHSNNLVYLHLCQHSQGAQVDSIWRMQLRPSGI